MLGFLTIPHTHPITPIPKPKSLIPIPKHPNLKNPKRLTVSFSSNKPNGNDANNDGDEEKKDERPRFNLKWSELLFDPDPNNVVAVGLTGVLAWASVQVLWQVFVISFAILVAAVKYSFIAALLIFILITLL